MRGGKGKKEETIRGRKEKKNLEKKKKKPWRRKKKNVHAGRARLLDALAAVPARVLVHADALVPVPERAVAADAGAVAVAAVVVEVAAAAAASRPVARDRDRVDDDVGDQQAVGPAAAVRVRPSAAPKIGRPIELRAVPRAVAAVAAAGDAAVAVDDDLIVGEILVHGDLFIVKVEGLLVALDLHVVPLVPVVVVVPVVVLGPVALRSVFWRTEGGMEKMSDFFLFFLPVTSSSSLELSLSSPLLSLFSLLTWPPPFWSLFWPALLSRWEFGGKRDGVKKG